MDPVSGGLTVTWANTVFTGADSDTWSLYTTYSHHFQINVSPRNLPNSGSDRFAISSVYKTLPGFGTNASTDPYGVFSADGSRIRITDVYCSTVADFKAKLQSISGGVDVCYALAEPQTYQLTPTQIALLKGSNTLWSDGDSLTLTYLGTTPANLLGGMLGLGNTQEPIEETSEESVEEPVSEEPTEGEDE